MGNLICNNFINNITKPQIVSNNSNSPNKNINNSSQNQYSESPNLIERYLNNLGISNSIKLTKNNEISKPSEIEGFNNYILLDNIGNEITNVSYKKDGDAIVQNIKVKSIDGSTVERITSNSKDTKSLNFIIKDNLGNVLLNQEKSYKKIDKDKAQTIINGKTYNISGLSSDVLSVEHNGETTTIDLNKMLNEDVITGIDKNDKEIIRETKITPEEKEELFAKIKSFNGDDLFRLSQSTNSIQYFSGMDSFFINKNKTLLLQIDKRFDNNVMIHELGHAYNNKNNTHDNINTILSSNENMSKIREQATEQYLNNKNADRNDKRFYGKFLDIDNYMNHYDNKENAIATMQDEIFAESYSVLNNTDILDFDGGLGCPERILSMMRYMPKAFVEVNNLV